jgi:xanthine dehydrogenase/oxidase
MQIALFQADNVYYVDHFSVTGHCCKTNLQSNTAFRGFGGPQSLLVAETWIEHIADLLGMDPLEVREKNLYKEGDKTPFNMVLENFTLRR